MKTEILVSLSFPHFLFLIILKRLSFWLDVVEVEMDGIARQGEREGEQRERLFFSPPSKSSLFETCSASRETEVTVVQLFLW